MSDSPPPNDEIPMLRRRTAAERLEYLLHEVALMTANHLQLERKVQQLERRLKKLEGK